MATRDELVGGIEMLIRECRRLATDLRPEQWEGVVDLDGWKNKEALAHIASIGGACTGLGIPPRAVHGVLGVAKAYTTRVGEGPLPTELHGEMGERLRESGQEYGASTGRPRRCGWYDAVAVRYAVRVNGIDSIALTKLDVLDGLDQIEICTGYRIGDRTVSEFPSDLNTCGPITPYSHTSGCRS